MIDSYTFTAKKNEVEPSSNSLIFVVVSVLILNLLSACTAVYTPNVQQEDLPVSTQESPSLSPQLKPLGYVLQFGAFANSDYAFRLVEQLNNADVEAYYYVDADGLYKVRTGDFMTVKQAQKSADELVRKGLVASYYIVPPSSYVSFDSTHLLLVRQKIIKTAQRFIGIPYKWGGTSTEDGFDCSGLSMVSYNLNGINLPRTSKIQYKKGRLISRENMQPADLVFFSTDLSGKVNHVGVYAGNDVFIHAPRTGKKIKKASLSSPYFVKRFVGARSYL